MKRAQAGRGAIAAALLFLSGTAAPPDPPRVLGFDHLPVAVADLEAAEARFRALGFTLKPGRFHANGIRNAHAKFADGSAIELITAPRAVDALTRAYRDHIARGDGPAFLALHVATLDGLAPALGRFGARADDGTVTFPDGPLGLLFFGTRERPRTDRPSHFRHANGAVALERVWLSPSAPVRALFEALGARFRPARRCLPECRVATVAALAEGELILSGPPVGSQRPITGVTIRVRALDGTRAALRAGGVPYRTLRPGSIFVAPQDANGMWIEFRDGRERGG